MSKSSTSNGYVNNLHFQSFFRELTVLVLPNRTSSYSSQYRSNQNDEYSYIYFRAWS